MNETNRKETDARSILLEAMRRRIRLTPHGLKLIVDYTEEIPPDFEQILIENKPALLNLLRSKRHLAKQILSGEFSVCPAATWHALNAAMLENYFDPLCHGAIEHLKKSVRQIQ